MTLSQFDTAQIRKTLDRAFDDSEFDAFCFDYFRGVYNRFGQGMGKHEKIQSLLDYCSRRQSGFETLLKKVRKEYAYLAEPGKTSSLKNQHLLPLIEALEEAIKDEGSKTDNPLPTPPKPEEPQMPPVAQFPSWVIAAGGIIVLLLGIFLGSNIVLPNSEPPEVALLPTEASPTIPPPTNRPILTLGIGSTRISEKDGMTLLYVPEGEFEMGSAEDDPDAQDDEKPRHTVYLDAYWIDQTEVTNAMFERFVEETGHKTEAEKEGWAYAYTDSGWQQVDGADWQHPQGPESDLTGLESHPVVQVSWDDAKAYCQWAGRRLPSEAEWEKAAGGTDSRKWPWGNDAPNGDLLNFCDENCPFAHKDSSINDGYQFTSPVGNYPAGASPYEALDMAGNVWEWVNDSWDSNYYASSPKDNPQGPTPQSTKVLRGGTWFNSVRNARARLRVANNAILRVVDWGFRCARSLN